MRQICTERFKKFICAMSVMLLMLGMCFRVMEADSFLSYICVTRNAAITIGNIVGSNILNILIILGITALIMPLKVQPSCFKIDIPYMIGITFVLIFLGYTGKYVTRIEGGILLILFIAYLSYLFVLTKKAMNP